MRTNQSAWKETDLDYGIFEGDTFYYTECGECEELYESYNQETPCRICPKPGTELIAENQLAWQLWQMLHTTGRTYGFSMGPIREEAIDAILRRYECNSIGMYEKLFMIESYMLPHIQKEQEKTRERDKKTKQVEHKKHG